MLNEDIFDLLTSIYPASIIIESGAKRVSLTGSDATSRVARISCCAIGSAYKSTSNTKGRWART